MVVNLGIDLAALTQKERPVAESRNSADERDIFIEAPPRPGFGRKSLVAIAIAVLVLLWSFQGAKIRPGELIEGIPQIFATLGRMLPPDFTKITDPKNYFLPEDLTLTELLLPLPIGDEQTQMRQRWWNNTFPQTVIGATLGDRADGAWRERFWRCLWLFLGFFGGAQHDAASFVYHVLRGGLNLVRSIPDLALGFCSSLRWDWAHFAGTLALAIHTATVLGKLLSESAENIDEGVVEALRATGAGYPQILSFAVVPQILPDLISFTLYRLETNIRAASVLGLIGAGGIGYLMNSSFRTFQYQEAAAIVLVLIALVMFVDYVSSRLRNLVV